MAKPGYYDGKKMMKRSTIGVSRLKVWKTVNREKFISAWMNLDSIREVAEAMGMNPNSVRCYAYALRKEGVAIPNRYEIRRVQTTGDVSELNRLVARELEALKARV